jgi:hypothetical protein
MNKEMHYKCQNHDMVIFSRLPEDVQRAMIPEKRQLFNNRGFWDEMAHDSNIFCNMVYRLHPDVKPEPEVRKFKELPVIIMSMGDRVYYSLDSVTLLTAIVGCREFAGIVYEKDGKQTLRTFMNPDFGTPVRVRLFE